MNTERIKYALNRNSSISGWFLDHRDMDVLTVIRLPGLVFFRDGKPQRVPNPQPREVIRAPGEETWVSVLCRFERDGRVYMGDATGQILSDAQSAVEQTLGELTAAAHSQPNEPWSLPESSNEYPTMLLADPTLKTATPREVLAQAQSFIDDVLAAAGREQQVEVSNLEVFVHRYHERFESSAGTKLEYDLTRTDAEICLLAHDGERVGEHTARLHARRLVDLNPAQIAASCATIARGVTIAGPASDYNGPIVLAGEAARDFLILDKGPFGFHSSARLVFEKTSRYRPGAPVTGDAPLLGEPLNLVSDPLIPYGHHSAVTWLNDGSPARQVPLVANGNFAELLGERRYFDYLGLTARGTRPSGPVGNTVIPPGPNPVRELEAGDRIVVVRAFSDFQCDDASGDFASEIRLGELHEGGRTTLFRGGLLVGNYFKALAEACYSSELQSGEAYYGPEAVRFGGLHIAG